MIRLNRDKASQEVSENGRHTVTAINMDYKIKLRELTDLGP